MKKNMKINPKNYLNDIEIIKTKDVNFAKETRMQDASHCPQSCCYISVVLVLCCCKMVTLVSHIVPVATIASIIHFIDEVKVKR